MPQLVDVTALTKDDLNDIFEKSEHYLSSVIANETTAEHHQGKVATNLFFEHSTRTCNSFQLAEMRHDMIVLTPNMDMSALSKGETINDMVLNLQSMGTKLFVVRHDDHQAMLDIIPCLNDEARLINAGSGMSHHPTQAILDIFTMTQYKPKLEDLSVAVIGDIKHSRVARSLIPLMQTAGIKDIRLIAPPELMAPELVTDNVMHHASIREGLKNADIAYCLRIQKERIDKRKHPTNDTFHAQYGLTEELLTFAKSDAIVMHPGPINRGIEIASSVADGPQSVILQQVENSTAVRMAIIDYVFL